MATIMQVLEHVINDGLEAVKDSYKEGSNKLKGSIAGFESCRNKTVQELEQLLNEASQMVYNARLIEHEDYWFWRCKQAEIEWVCNVISVILLNEKLPIITAPTARGVLKAAEILKRLGVE